MLSYQVRSVYRTIELSEGFDGFLTRTEVYFYALDFVPLIVALAIYLPFWPGRFVPHTAPGAFAGDGETLSPEIKHASADEGTLQGMELAEPKAQ